MQAHVHSSFRDESPARRVSLDEFQPRDSGRPAASPRKMATVSADSAPSNARRVLWYLTFFGFAINYMVRININITIVDMIVAKPSVQQQQLQLDLANGSGVTDLTRLPDESTVGDPIRVPFSLERLLLDRMGINYTRHGFDWNEMQQGAMLGSYFWLHWVTQIPGGILARRFGTKLVFGVANLIGCLLCVVMPLVAYLDYRWLINIRLLQGLICGLCWPSMHLMTARWIPPNERSNFVTAYLGSSVGVAVFYPIFGFVLSVSSWEWVFHLCGIVGTVWYVAWYFLVFDSPATHPRISMEERRYIELSLGDTVQKVGYHVSPTPWKAILRSAPVWVISVAQFGGVWGLFTLMTQAPTYFRTIHGWNVGMTGVLSGLPHLMRMVFAYVFSVFGDWLLTRQLMSRTNVRKLAGTFSMIVGGCFVIGLAYCGSHAGLAITLLVLATSVHGAVSTGPLANLVDISPNYSGITLGLTGMFAVLPGFISPYIVGLLTMNNQTSQQWQYVFLLTAAMLIGCGVVYVLFTVSELQPWNSPEPLNEIGLEPRTPEQKQLLVQEKKAEGK